MNEWILFPQLVRIDFIVIHYYGFVGICKCS